MISGFLINILAQLKPLLLTKYIIKCYKAPSCLNKFVVSFTCIRICADTHNRLAKNNWKTCLAKPWSK